jgi:uncharacterized protein (DUF58 family)
MELSQDLMIDVALNAAGYIAAAGLALTVFSLFRRKNSATAAAVTSPIEAAVVAGDRPAPFVVKTPGSGPKMEFLKLSGDASTGADEPEPKTEVKPDDGRRDRSEIIRVAREMLKAGATTDKITSILPISQAEVALLSAGRR